MNKKTTEQIIVDIAIDHLIAENRAKWEKKNGQPWPKSDGDYGQN